MSSEFVRNLLIEQRRRVVGSIMTHAEKNVFPTLSPAQQRVFRDKVLSSIGVYHDTCLDILKASVDDGSVVNADALSMITEIHQAVRKGRPDAP
jgi:hypothetical protein